jgi:site-specific DNA-methyltransferase (adenine-specific)
MKVIHVLRKPLTGTVASNVLTHGTGGLNIDGCRIGTDMMPRTKSDGTIKSHNVAMAAPNTGRIRLDDVQGRWPANFILQQPLSFEGEEGFARYFWTYNGRR